MQEGETEITTTNTNVLFPSTDMQKLGQHFLKNAATLEKIVGALALADGSRVIEIGSGHGELTALLAHATRGKQCKIFCIEKDRALIKDLEPLVVKEQPINNTDITIIEGDALTLLPETISSFPRKGHYEVVGNIPYYITGKLLRIFSELEHKPERTVLLIQKEVAERICAVAPAMNRLAASVQFWADVAIIAAVPRKDFSPPPDVDSAIIVLKEKLVSSSRTMAMRPPIDAALYYRAVRGIFAQPRKTLLNNLSSSMDTTTTKGAVAAQLKKIGIDPASRPQDLTINQIIAIANAPLWG